MSEWSPGDVAELVLGDGRLAYVQNAIKRDRWEPTLTRVLPGVFAMRPSTAELERLVAADDAFLVLLLIDIDEDSVVTRAPVPSSRQQWPPVRSLQPAPTVRNPDGWTISLRDESAVLTGAEFTAAYPDVDQTRLPESRGMGPEGLIRRIEAEHDIHVPRAPTERPTREDGAEYIYAFTAETAGENARWDLEEIFEAFDYGVQMFLVDVAVPGFEDVWYLIVRVDEAAEAYVAWTTHVYDGRLVGEGAEVVGEVFRLSGLTRAVRTGGALLDASLWPADGPP